MKLRKLGLFLIVAVFLIMLAPIVRGDVFPKPRMTLWIQGIEEPYYFDLLIHKDYVPQLRTDIEIAGRIDNYYYRDDYPEALNGYQDSDGYVSYQLYNGAPTHITQEEVGSDYQVFNIGYFSPPQRFKILVYTESGIMLTSKITTRMMFDAEFTYDLSGVDKTIDQVNIGRVTEQLPLARIGIEFVARLLLTVLTEIGILFCFGFRMKKSYFVVLIVNLFTQTLLTVGILVGHYAMSEFFGAVFILIVGELIVIALETVVYARLLKERSTGRAAGYALVANLASMVVSFFLIVLGNYI